MSGKTLPTLSGMMRHLQHQHVPLSSNDVLYIRTRDCIFQWFFEFFLPCHENIKELIFFFFLSFSKPTKEAKSGSVQAL